MREGENMTRWWVRMVIEGYFQEDVALAEDVEVEVDVERQARCKVLEIALDATYVVKVLVNTRLQRVGHLMRVEVGGDGVTLEALVTRRGVHLCDERRH